MVGESGGRVTNPERVFLKVSRASFLRRSRTLRCPHSYTSARIRRFASNTSLRTAQKAILFQKGLECNLFASSTNPSSCPYCCEATTRTGIRENHGENPWIVRGQTKKWRTFISRIRSRLPDTKWFFCLFFKFHVNTSDQIHFFLVANLHNHFWDTLYVLVWGRNGEYTGGLYRASVIHTLCCVGAFSLKCTLRAGVGLRGKPRGAYSDAGALATTHYTASYTLCSDTRGCGMRHGRAAWGGGGRSDEARARRGGSSPHSWRAPLRLLLSGVPHRGRSHRRCWSRRSHVSSSKPGYVRSVEEIVERHPPLGQHFVPRPSMFVSFLFTI